MQSSNLVKLETNHYLPLCVLHTRTLNVPGKIIGTSPEKCSECIPKRTDKKNVYITILQIDVNIICKIFCEDCLSIFQEVNSTNLKGLKDAPYKTYKCFGCGLTAPGKKET